jgi:hypothetical protein
MARGAALALSLGAAVLVAGSAQALPEPSRFTFPSASRVSPQEGFAAAKAFVEKRLPRGLPMDEAVARAEAAKSSCGDWQIMSGDIVCRYSIGAATDQPSVGYDEWLLTLIHGKDGKLASVAIVRSLGSPGEPARVVFHWRSGE